MTEIKKTLAILKARWPEVILIIGLTVLLPFLSKLLTKLKYDSALSLTVLAVLALAVLATSFSLALMLITIMLRSGFLRTVYLEGRKRQTIAVLLRTGLHFLWRMIVLGLLYTIPLLTLTLLSIRLVGKPTAPGELVINIILMKFILLLPALVIVLDCRVFESFKFLKKCRLRDAGELIALFCFQMVFPYLWMFLRTLYGAATTPPLTFRIVSSITTCFIGLMIAVMAVRFVASLDLTYDGGQSSLNLGNLVEPSTED
jgi:hypothetical protein